MSSLPQPLQPGGFYTCILLNEETVKCWGQNKYGQLGLGDITPRTVAQLVNLGSNVTATAIAAGRYHTCTILNRDSVKCWGHNEYGKLGLGDETTPGNNKNRGDESSETVDNLKYVNIK